MSNERSTADSGSRRTRQGAAREAEADGWIAEARLGSEVALDALIERLSEHLWAELASRRKRTSPASHGSSDLVQDTLMRVREQFDMFERDSFTDFKQWARAVLYRRRLEWRRNHQSRNSQRHKQVLSDLLRSRATEMDRHTAHELAVERQEDADRANRLFESLKPHERFIISLRLFKGMSYAEIAAITERTEEAARKAYDRAVHKLREKFDAHEEV